MSHAAAGLVCPEIIPDAREAITTMPMRAVRGDIGFGG
jgi:hypothetical protein